MAKFENYRANESKKSELSLPSAADNVPWNKGKVFDVNEMIDYADGGVVSKELNHNDSGSVTLLF